VYPGMRYYPLALCGAPLAVTETILKMVSDELPDAWL
jgi:hypothetical protein